jgi:hypothetical protein
MGNSNAFKAIIALVVIMFGVFALITYMDDGDVVPQGPSNLDDSSSYIDGKRTGGEGEEETMSAKELAVDELCSCFVEVLELRSKIEADSRLEFELSSKIKKAEINMRSCYIKSKEKNSSFGKSLLEDFEFACPDAQEEL